MSQENLTVGNRCPFDRPEPDGEKHKSAGKIRAGTSNPQFILIRFGCLPAILL